MKRTNGEHSPADLSSESKPGFPAPLSPKSGSNFVTYELQEEHSGVLRFVPSKGLIIFFAIYSGLACAAIALGLLIPFLSGNLLGLVGIPAGIVLHLVGGQQKRLASVPREINIPRRLVTVPTVSNRKASSSHAISFDMINRIELIEKTLDGGEDNDYRCFELIVALKDGHRALLVEHANREIMQRDGARIAKVIGCDFVQA